MVLVMIVSHVGAVAHVSQMVGSYDTRCGSGTEGRAWAFEGSFNR